MSGHFYLDWATVAVSLFNTILLLWLGGTVLLNADRRTWGIWLAGGGLLLGGLFFASHSTILGLDFRSFTGTIRFWWYLGLVPAVALPLSWYVVVLWYSGYWNAAETALHRRQRLWLLGLLSLAAGGLALLLIYGNPLPERLSLLPLRFTVQRVGGTPLLVAGYAVYLVACIGLSLDALLRPGPTARVMGDLARQRARRWLVVASLFLLLVSLVVIGSLLWMLLGVRQDGSYLITEGVLVMLARLDLLVSGLIAVTVILLGQAVVLYEIFTGKTLPRGGLRRQWRRALLLAAGYGALVGWTLSAHWRPVYSVVLATVLMTVFFALLNWRSYAERERYIDSLRPFVSSERLYDRLLAPSSAATLPAETDARLPFRALCREVLGAGRAYLVPLGPLAPLAGAPLVYPEGDLPALPPLNELAARLDSPRQTGLPLESERYGGAAWAIPLWSERGLIGMLLLGEKRDGGLYTQEEMEIARASGERLIDSQASAAMARRLLALQRQQLAASQVADRRTRQVLHDEVLPQLHAALLALGEGEAGGEAAALLSDAHRQISDLLRDVPAVVTPEVARLGVLVALQRALEEELASAFDGVQWEIDPDAAAAAQAIPPLTGEVLFYAAREAVRNAARHGRGAGEERPLQLRVEAHRHDATFELLIEDNGVGLTEGGEGGRGLALHSTMMAVVGGTLALESAPGRYTRVRLTLPDRREKAALV